MKKALYLTILIAVALSFQAAAQQSSIFPKGEKSPNVLHIGNVWLSHVSNADSTFKYNIAEATFENR